MAINEITSGIGVGRRCARCPMAAPSLPRKVGRSPSTTAPAVFSRRSRSVRRSARSRPSPTAASSQPWPGEDSSRCASPRTRPRHCALGLRGARGVALDGVTGRAVVTSMRSPGRVVRVALGPMVAQAETIASNITAPVAVALRPGAGDAYILSRTDPAELLHLDLAPARRRR